LLLFSVSLHCQPTVASASPRGHLRPRGLVEEAVVVFCGPVFQLAMVCWRLACWLVSRRILARVGRRRRGRGREWVSRGRSSPVKRPGSWRRTGWKQLLGARPAQSRPGAGRKGRRVQRQAHAQPSARSAYGGPTGAARGDGRDWLCAGRRANSPRPRQEIRQDGR